MDVVDVAILDRSHRHAVQVDGFLYCGSAVVVFPHQLPLQVIGKEGAVRDLLRRGRAADLVVEADEVDNVGLAILVAVGVACGGCSFKDGRDGLIKVGLTDHPIIAGIAIELSAAGLFGDTLPKAVVLIAHSIGARQAVSCIVDEAIGAVV